MTGRKYVPYKPIGPVRNETPAQKAAREEANRKQYREFLQQGTEDAQRAAEDE